MTATTRLTLAGGVAATLAVLPLVPITDTNGWLVPAAFAVFLIALTGWGVRRVAAARWPVPVAQLAVLTLWLGLLVAADVAWMGVVPTRAWLERLGAVTVDGIDVVMEYAPPVPVERPMLFIIVAGAGLVAIGVELAVFGLGRVPFAGLPIVLMYAIAASVAREGWSWLWFVFPAAGFLGVLITEGRNRVTAWGLSAGPSGSGEPETDSLARNGRRVGTVALAAAVVVPAALPALTQSGIGGGFGSGSGGGGHTIRTDNPIVDLQRDLTRPDNVPVLQYITDSEDPGYIRTTALDIFNGDEWASSSRTVSELEPNEELPPPPGVSIADGEPTTDTYEFEITENFSSTWLPLVYPAHRIDIQGNWQYDAATLDVVADTERDQNVQGMEYEADSIVVERDARELQDAPPSDDPVQFQQQFDRMLELPPETRDLLEPYINEAIGDATTTYEQAVALQSWFRTEGGFDYSLETPAGNSSSALLDFLEERSGYCEQYAATMGIMARYLGIPARVGVGFTPGERQGDDTWLVRAHDAHAWPELYFTGIGWVRFEPTPATRTGSPPDWTVPPPEGEDSADDDDQNGAPDLPDGELPPGLQDQFGDAGGAGLGDDEPSRWPAVLLGVGLAGAVLTAPAATAWSLRSRRWRRAAGDAVLEAEAAWADLRDAVRDVGWRWDRAATPRAIHRYVSGRVDLDEQRRQLLGRLAMAVERARYAAHADHVPGLRDDAAVMRATLLRPLPWWQRLRAWLWPVAVSDVMVAAGYAVSDGMAWLDTAGERLRARLSRSKPHLN